MRHLLTMGALGYGFYNFWNSTGDLYTPGNFLAMGFVGLAILIEFMARD